MNRYLIVYFDRYETEESGHSFVVADTPVDALITDMKANKKDWDEDEERYYRRDFMVVSDTFSCLPGEEQDILVYKINEGPNLDMQDVNKGIDPF